MKYLFKVTIFFAILLVSCSKTSSDYVPKPKGFNRIDIPAHAYQSLNGNYPYTFEYSKQATIEADKSVGAEPYWIIVNYPTLNAKVQFTYKPLNGDLDKLDKHVADAYKLAAKHQIKATGQTEQVLTLKSGKKAVIIQIEGEVPSHFQFYMTDTSKNFIRGAMYLNRSTFNDSLNPIIDYVKIDCRHLIETLNWKK
jgi:gliding motility-associated lipoprotein GldD